MTNIETLLESYTDWVFREGYAHGRGTKDKADNAEKKAEEIKVQLLSLLKSGLTLQRMENWKAKGSARTITCRYGYVKLSDVNRDDIQGSGQTLTEGMNSVLDMIGIE